MKLLALRFHCVALLALAGLLCGCTGKAPNAASVPSEQRVFASPEEAAGVLKDAVAAKDQKLLMEIYGPDGMELVLSGDPVQDDNRLERFGAHLAEQLRVDHPSADRAVLYIGARNWPFPIPLVKGSGGWYFDTSAGKDELLNRRIGRNELNAIAVCRAYVAAQKEYARVDRDGSGITHYAQHFRSSEGKKDGLYWPVAEGEPLSPMGPLVAQARLERYDTIHRDGKRQPYQGYFFHVLTAQGDAVPGGKMSYAVDGRLVKGFALVASPAEWGSSGVMTFIVNQDGKVYEKNLGAQTSDLVKGITEYNPDKSWQPVKDY